MLDAVERLEKPVVAAIDGVATGAGLTLALCCDWRDRRRRARGCSSARAAWAWSPPTAA